MFYLCLISQLPHLLFRISSVVSCKCCLLFTFLALSLGNKLQMKKESKAEALDSFFICSLFTKPQCCVRKGIQSFSFLLSLSGQRSNDDRNMFSS